MINNNDINIKEELTFEQRVELRDTKLEIALILYNWLLDYIKTDKNKNNKEKDTESINHSIDYIVKFISYTKELDAIYRILILYIKIYIRIMLHQKKMILLFYLQKKVK